ncbi:MAG: type II toxin-antitoxin system VapC family toxin [bacterium]|nr:type II toxin-antitoxin system VapC family toxin [bacterium]
MISSYLDASALVKRYVAEPGAEMVMRAIAEAPAVATSMISRVEVVTALAGALRRGALTSEDAETARQSFHSEWSGFIRIPVTEFMLERAALLGWEQGIRGYDAVQLAAAVTWREVLEDAVAMVTFDRQLWLAAANVGLIAHPEHLPEVLDSWKGG